MDGQQRLITLCLIFGALKCRLRTELEGEDLSEGRRALITNLDDRLAKMLWDEGDDGMERSPAPRVELKRKDAEFFDRFLQDPVECTRQEYDGTVLRGETQRNIWQNLQVRWLHAGLIACGCKKDHLLRR